MAEKVKEFKGGPGSRGRGPKPKVDNPGIIMKRLFGMLFKSYGAALIVVAICIVLSVVANVQGTWFTKNLIDIYIIPMVKTLNAGGAPNYTPLMYAMLKVAVFYGIGALSTFAYNRIMVYVTQGTLRNLRNQMFEHMEKLPIRYFDTHNHGDIMSIYTNDTDTLRQMISQSVPQVIVSATTIVCVLVSMIVMSIPMTIISVLMVCVMLLVSKHVTNRSGRYFFAQQTNLGKVNGFIEEMMEGQKVVKVFTHEEEAKFDFDKVNEELFESAYQANKYANILMPLIGNLGYVSYVLVAVVGGVLAINGYMDLTVGTLAAFLQLNRSFNQPIGQISQQINMVLMALAGAERIFALMDEEVEDDLGHVSLVNAKENADGTLSPVKERTGLWAWEHKRPDGSIEYVRLAGDVRFHDVTFGYNENKTILYDMNLFAKPGEKLAFVGATGAGKTTITNLINRFYDIQKGSITYDGINIKLIKKADLRRSLGIVLQDTHLFTGTVMDNIRYGKLDATDEECIEAAKLANAHEFIMHLEHGYQTILSGDGSSLSQGQCQLLAIARAAVANPPVLILDEATSSIDTRTESIVQSGMDKLMEGRTVFVIAHRLSTIKNSDAIMVLDQGRIIERGDHDKLIKEKGTYYQLYTGGLELD